MCRTCVVVVGIYPIPVDVASPRACADGSRPVACGGPIVRVTSRLLQLQPRIVSQLQERIRICRGCVR